MTQRDFLAFFHAARGPLYLSCRETEIDMATETGMTDEERRELREVFDGLGGAVQQTGPIAVAALRAAREAGVAKELALLALELADELHELAPYFSKAECVKLACGMVHAPGGSG